ncbi:glycosyltransferase family 4 protein [Photorhabdus luminescens]|uniref:Glycosyltransferase n=1 Tax=Photorhabdus luminescens subsp. sonorensis TaxID=1173677 RepID=A0A5C4RN53_PHOLU|nr:glycosyltransferase family 4 protein [Photorhabdus luminescens]TNH45199.1 hypothetical protein EP164_00455 [Photorhabdus luminescens subsp. sonorensis]
MRHCLFYIPSDIYGGTELLFTRLANKLTDNYIVTLLVKNLDLVKSFTLDNRINITLISDINDFKFDHVVISAKDMREFHEYNVRFNNILIWQLQPDELCAPILKYINRLRILNINIGSLSTFLTNILYYKRKKNLIQFVNKLIENFSLVFMDKPNYDTTCQWLNLTLCDIYYLPITSGTRRKRITKPKLINTKLVISIISRISFDFKYYPIYCFIENLFKTNYEIELNIVGDGEALNKLKNEVMKFQNEKSNIDIIYHGFMKNEAVFNELYPKTDLVVGMGTSILDSSSIGIPSLIMNVHPSYIKTSKIKYNWSYEQEGFSVGEYITSSNSKNNGYDLNEIIEQLYKNNTIIASKTYNYYIHHHSSDAILSRFLLVLENNKKIDDDLFKNHMKNIISSNYSSEKFIDTFFSTIRFFKKSL